MLVVCTWCAGRVFQGSETPSSSGPSAYPPTALWTPDAGSQAKIPGLASLAAPLPFPCKLPPPGFKGEPDWRGEPSRAFSTAEWFDLIPSPSRGYVQAQVPVGYVRYARGIQRDTRVPVKCIESRTEQGSREGEFERRAVWDTTAGHRTELQRWGGGGRDRTFLCSTLLAHTLRLRDGKRREIGPWPWMLSTVR